MKTCSSVTRQNCSAESLPAITSAFRQIEIRGPDLLSRPSIRRVPGNGQYETHRRARKRASSASPTMRSCPWPWLSSCTVDCAGKTFLGFLSRNLHGSVVIQKRTEDKESTLEAIDIITNSQKDDFDNAKSVWITSNRGPFLY